MIFQDLFDLLFTLLEKSLLIPFATDGSFRHGFFMGLFFAATLAWIARVLLSWKGEISRFFAHTILPATQHGPTPVNMFAGCVFATIRFLVVVTVIMVILMIGFTK